MSQHSDRDRQSDYFAARASEERRLAMASADRKVRAIHLEMAERYDELARGEDSPASQAADDDRQRTG